MNINNILRFLVLYVIVAVSLSMPCKVVASVELYEHSTRVEDAKKEALIEDMIKKNQTLILSGPSSGAEQPQIYLIKFFDYQCGPCKKVSSVLHAIQDREPSLRIIYKDFPIINQISVYAAKAALAAQKQNQYAAFSYALLQEPEHLYKEKILATATQLGINRETLEQDIQDSNANGITKTLEQNLKLAKDLTIRTTPSIIIISTDPNKPIRCIFGSIEADTLQDLINQAKG